jgi:DNA uptake protein ComE-like DNA-binding protein
MKAGPVCQISKYEFPFNKYWPQDRQMKQNLEMGSRITVAVRPVLLAFIFAASVQSQDVRASAELVDINRASVAELLKVPGMTASWAERIVRFRPYHTKLELQELGVVTPEVYRRIRDGVIAHRVITDETKTQKNH